MTATLTLTAGPAANGTRGLFISLSSGGEHSGDDIDRRFYSILSVPPPEIAPHQFWGVVLRDVSSCLLAGGETGMIIPGGRGDF